MASTKNGGWFNEFIRHSNAKKIGKAGAPYANDVKDKKKPQPLLSRILGAEKAAEKKIVPFLKKEEKAVEKFAKKEATAAREFAEEKAIPFAREKAIPFIKKEAKAVEELAIKEAKAAEKFTKEKAIPEIKKDVIGAGKYVAESTKELFEDADNSDLQARENGGDVGLSGEEKEYLDDEREVRLAENELNLAKRKKIMRQRQVDENDSPFNLLSDFVGELPDKSGEPTAWDDFDNTITEVLDKIEDKPKKQSFEAEMDESFSSPAPKQRKGLLIEVPSGKVGVESEGADE